MHQRIFEFHKILKLGSSEITDVIRHTRKDLSSTGSIVLYIPFRKLDDL